MICYQKRVLKGDWCENHFRHFCRRPLQSEEETNGGFGRFLPGSLAMYFSYLGGIVG